MTRLNLLQRVLLFMLAPVFATLGALIAFVVVLGGLVYGAMFNTIEVKTNDPE